MLGWFKKKFKKDAPVVNEETVVDELTTDTSFSEHEQPEKELIKVVDTPVVDKTPELVVTDEPETVAEIAMSAETPAEEDVLASEPQEPLSSDDKSELIEQKPAVIEEPVIVEKPVAIDEPAAIEEQPVPVEEPFTEEVVQPVDEPVVEVKQEKKKDSLFSRLTDKLSKTRETFTYQMDALFLGKKVIDEDMLDDLEEVLITADLGVATTQDLLEYARRRVKRKELSDPKALRDALKKQISKLITDNEADATLVMPDKGPFVIMVIGVNGVGKTTTIGKIANKFLNAGSSVMLVAGDTFRAAAVSQLKIWGERNNVPVVSHKDGADPSAVVFDALGLAISQDIDVVLVDTAGRLHTQENLMEELKKIKRVMSKKLPGAPHETMLVIDATTGQNGISQARLFDAAVDVTGLTLTKLDGTSKGGIVANICKEMKIPIRFIGIGEQMDDLRDFNANDFSEALFQGRSDTQH